jgi:lactate dehydrogenase-like 2-hydroxyacid dehydrogenase
MAGTTVIAMPPLPDEARRVLEAKGVRLIELQRKMKEELLSLIGQARVLITGFMRIDKGFLDKATGLELIVTRSSGYDHIDVSYAEKKGICVANQPEAIAFSVAEHAIALIVAALKRIVRSHDYVVSGQWSALGWPQWARGGLLRGSTLGIVGMGRIGSLVAWYGRAMGVGRVLYWSRRRKPELEVLLLAEPASLERLFRESDVIVVALPRTRDTIGLIGYELLSSMKPGAVLVNVGRGGIVDEAALARIVREREDVYVALDVYSEEPLPENHELIKLAKETRRIILTAHHAGASKYTYVATAVLAAKQTIYFLERGTVWNPVNRACKAADDIPDLWSTIESILYRRHETRT